MKDERDTVTRELPIKPRAKTPAERQRNHRRKVRVSTERLDMRISNDAAFKLSCIVGHYCAPKKEVMEQIIDRAYERLLREQED